MIPVAVLIASVSLAGAQAMKLEEVASLANITPGQMKPNVILFNDHRQDEIADSTTGLIRFEDWARAHPVQKEYLSLYPSYIEPMLTVTVDGVTKSFKNKLSMYVLEARFMLPKAPSAVELPRYASVSFLNGIDPAIKHQAITAADVIPAKDEEYAFNRHPARAWCSDASQSVCIQSRYQLEGKLPSAIHVANMLVERKRHDDFFEFQSELRVVPTTEIDEGKLKKLTAIDTQVTGVLEQNIFYFNKVIEF
jgi:hypothetical protein